MFLLLGDQLVNASDIDRIDFSRIDELTILVHLKDHPVIVVLGIQAIDLLMAIKPSALESRRLRWYRHAWAAHNLIGHPLMQLLAFFKQYKLAMRVHDLTVPRPIGRKLHAEDDSRRNKR